MNRHEITAIISKMKEKHVVLRAHITGEIDSPTGSGRLLEGDDTLRGK